MNGNGAAPQSGHAGKGDWVHDVLRRHEAGLLRYAQHLLGDAEQARDVVQDTFLRLCREDPQSLDGHLTEWLFTVCRNRALDIRRKERRMTTLAEDTAARTASHEPSPAALVEQRDTAGHLLIMLTTLPRNQQEVLRLKFQNGLSYREISRITGLSVSNVGFLIHRGLTTLRFRLKSPHAEPAL